MNSRVRLLCWSKIICICLCLRRLREQSPMGEGIETIVLETQGPRSVCQCGVVLVGATFWLACYFFLLCPNRTGRGRGRRKWKRIGRSSCICFLVSSHESTNPSRGPWALWPDMNTSTSQDLCSALQAGVSTYKFWGLDSLSFRGLSPHTWEPLFNRDITLMRGQ